VPFTKERDQLILRCTEAALACIDLAQNSRPVLLDRVDTPPEHRKLPAFDVDLDKGQVADINLRQDAVERCQRNKLLFDLEASSQIAVITDMVKTNADIAF
jgi:hypothetical protein